MQSGQPFAIYEPYTAKTQFSKNSPDAAPGCTAKVLGSPYGSRQLWAGLAAGWLHRGAFSAGNDSVDMESTVGEALRSELELVHAIYGKDARVLLIGGAKPSVRARPSKEAPNVVLTLQTLGA